MDETYDARHDHGIFFLMELPSNEHDQKENKANEETDDSATLPGMRLASILQREDIACEQADHQSCADKVKLQDLLSPGGLRRLRALFGLKKKKVTAAAIAPTGKLIQKHFDAVRMAMFASGDVGDTNPTPSEPFSKSAAEKRSHHSGNGIHGSDHTEILRTLGRRRGEPDNAEQADCHTRAANTLDCSTDNQHGWTRCNGANDTADLKDQDSNQVPQLNGQILEQLSPCGLEATKGHEISCAVP